MTVADSVVACRLRSYTMTVFRVEDVFSRSRLQMVTSREVEVVREAAAPGERRR